MFKGMDVVVQARSKSVMENGTDRGIREEKWMSVSAGTGLLERPAMGTLSLVQTLAVLDSYQRQPTDEQTFSSSSSWSLYSAAVASCPPELPVSLPLASTTWLEQVSLQWDHFLNPATRFQAHLKYLPVP